MAPRAQAREQQPQRRARELLERVERARRPVRAAAQSQRLPDLSSEALKT